MTFLTLKNCCFVVNLRLGTFIIALICSLIECIALMVNLLAIWALYDAEDETGREIHVLRFLMFLFMFFTCIKLFLCATLYSGLIERRPDHLQIWFAGYTLCEVLYLAFTTVRVFQERNGTTMFWMIITGNFITILVTMYFIVVVRSYYHRMCREPNYYQDFSYQHPKIYGKTKDDGDIVLFSAPTKEKDGFMNPTYRHNEHNIYTTPQSNQMNANLPVMPSTYLTNEKRPSYDAVKNQNQDSLSAQKKNVSFTKGA